MALLARHSTLKLAWAVALAIPLAIVGHYVARWLNRPTGTSDTDRVVFVSACAAVTILIGVGLRLRLFDLRTARRSHGLCEDCGYDLRHSTECCPECGRPVPKPSALP